MVDVCTMLYNQALNQFLEVYTSESNFPVSGNRKQKTFSRIERSTLLVLCVTFYL